MIVEEEGVKKVKRNWRRRIFQWEIELVDICNGVALGADRSSNSQDLWKWSEDQYTVKKVYDLLTREETEDCEWVKDVWNPLIPSKMSMLGWRLFQSRLPTKHNRLKRGVRLTTSYLCVGGCDGVETESRLNAMIFNWEGFEWEKVVEETKVPSWRILRTPLKGFNYQLSEWMENSTMCLGIVTRE
ncbi:unnamed protein product [Trifolium pratense]|uniref:Uncharacterized protein n=1 Tax=Trifolium pratense TaxID=57577 RepID=A0ACB0LEJ8_TRIPR|nr:unnamed protein product [Trifolium pratense]